MSSEAWTALGLVIVGLFGGGGIVGVLQWRTSAKRGEHEDEREGGTAVATQMKVIIDAQFESLVTPLRESVSELQAEVRDIKAQLEDQRNRYWKVVGFARTLLWWIERTFGDHGHSIPEVPDEVRDDVEIR